MRQNRKTLRTEYPGNVGRSNCCGGTYSYYNLDGSPVHNCGQWYTNIPCSAVTSEFACNLNEMYQTYWTYCSYNAPVVMDFTDCHGCGAPGTGGNQPMTEEGMWGSFEENPNYDNVSFCDGGCVTITGQTEPCCPEGMDSVCGCDCYPPGNIVQNNCFMTGGGNDDGGGSSDDSCTGSCVGITGQSFDCCPGGCGCDCYPPGNIVHDTCNTRRGGGKKSQPRRKRPPRIPKNCR